MFKCLAPKKRRGKTQNPTLTEKKHRASAAAAFPLQQTWGVTFVAASQSVIVTARASELQSFSVSKRLGCVAILVVFVA